MDAQHTQLLEGQPPGTILLEANTQQEGTEIILNPTPSNDPNQPLNWPLWYKIWNFFIVLYFVLAVAAATDIGTVIYGDQADELGITFQQQNIAFGLNCAGLAIGVVFLMPVVLKYGRKPVLIANIVASLGSTVWQAKLMTGTDVILSNLLAGVGGGISEAICQVSIADTFFTHQFGAANAAYLVTVELGAFLAPVAAGYAAEAQGWRWIWWWMTIILGIDFIITMFGYEDTAWVPITMGAFRSGLSAEVHADRPRNSEDDDGNVKRISTSSKPIVHKAFDKDPTSRIEHVSIYDSCSVPRNNYWQKMRLYTVSPGSWQQLATHLWRPFYVMVAFPAVSFACISFASLGAWFSLIVSVYSQQFTLPPYNFSAEAIGLMNLAPFVGSLIGAIYSGLLVDRSVIWLSRRNNGIFEPEMRLWTALPSILTMPAALLIFGLGTAHGLHWIVPATGAALFGFSFAALGDSALTYAMDCYGEVSQTAKFNGGTVTDSVTDYWRFLCSRCNLEKSCCNNFYSCPVSMA